MGRRSARRLEKSSRSVTRARSPCAPGGRGLHRHVEPFAVTPHLGALAVQHLEGLLLKGERVAVDLLGVQHGAQRGAPRRVPHPPVKSPMISTTS